MQMGRDVQPTKNLPGKVKDGEVSQLGDASPAGRQLSTQAAVWHDDSQILARQARAGWWRELVWACCRMLGSAGRRLPCRCGASGLGNGRLEIRYVRQLAANRVVRQVEK